MILSEVLSNEPQGRVRLEWIELYNGAAAEANLGDYLLVVDSDTNFLPEAVVIPPYEYAILARQLIPVDGSDSFESYWGDSSGIWGDAPTENYTALDIDFTLSNNSGDVVLMTSDAQIIDEIAWETASDDGRSIERDDVNDPASGWHDCFDPLGSTPGRSNSRIPQGGGENFSVEIVPIVISLGDNGFDDFYINVVIPPATKLSVSIYDETGYKVISLLDGSEINVVRLNWDGKDNRGKLVSPGIYIVSLSLSGGSNEAKNLPIVIAP